MPSTFHRTRLAVLAVTASLAAGVAHGASAQEQGGSSTPEPVVAPAAPGPSAASAKRREIESRVLEARIVETEDAEPEGALSDSERRLGPGRVVRGTLEASDPRADDETYYEEWTYQGRPGTRVSVRMSSGAFDAYLVWGRVVDGEFHALQVDDDGGEGRDSHLKAWIRDEGEYVVRANTYNAGEAGRYTLMMEEAPARPDPATPRGDLAPGQSRAGTLDSGDAVGSLGTYYEVWRYRGRPGERVILTVSSDAFDTHIVWAQLAGAEPIPVLSDDDGGPDTDSELTVQVEEEGEFVVIVSAMGSGQTGAYTLRVEPARR